jgi:nucleoside-diphosphate-sugar epimerase
MRYMVTGGAGFIGSHLCDELIRQGHEVLCVDNLATGQADNIAHLLSHKMFQFKGNITSFATNIKEIKRLSTGKMGVHYVSYARI